MAAATLREARDACPHWEAGEASHDNPADRIAAAWREEFAAQGFRIEAADFSRLALWAVHELGNEDDGAGFGLDSYARAAFVELFGREPDSEEDTQILEDVSEEIT